VQDRESQQYPWGVFSIFETVLNVAVGGRGSLPWARERNDGEGGRGRYGRYETNGRKGRKETRRDEETSVSQGGALRVGRLREIVSPSIPRLVAISRRFPAQIRTETEDGGQARQCTRFGRIFITSLGVNTVST